MKRLFFLFIFIVTALVIYMERVEFISGLEGYLYGDTDIAVIQSLEELPSSKSMSPRDVKAVGIPDYENICRFSFQEEFFTCFRMVDFANKLLVCSAREMESPEAIDEIIKPRKFIGRLTRLKDSPFKKTIRRCLKKSGNIDISSKGYVLLDGQSALPPLNKIILLLLCLVVCIFSFFRFLK